jgi:hypothetical protein
MTERSVCIRSDDVALTDLDGEMVLLDIDSGQYFGLNDVGTTVFQLVERPMPVADVIEHLQATYADVPRDQLRRDVIAFLRQMHSHGLIRLAQSDTSQV